MIRRPTASPDSTAPPAREPAYLNGSARRPGPQREQGGEAELPHLRAACGPPSLRLHGLRPSGPGREGHHLDNPADPRRHRDGTGCGGFRCGPQLFGRAALRDHPSARIPSGGSSAPSLRAPPSASTAPSTYVMGRFPPVVRNDRQGHGGYLPDDASHSRALERGRRGLAEPSSTGLDARPAAPAAAHGGS